MIPKWFWKLLISMCVICLCIIGYKIAAGERNRAFIWYSFLFLMAIWFAIRQQRNAS